MSLKRMRSGVQCFAPFQQRKKPNHFISKNSVDPINTVQCATQTPQFTGTTKAETLATVGKLEPKVSNGPQQKDEVYVKKCSLKREQNIIPREERYWANQIHSSIPNNHQAATSSVKLAPLANTSTTSTTPSSNTCTTSATPSSNTCTTWKTPGAKASTTRAAPSSNSCTTRTTPSAKASTTRATPNTKTSLCTVLCNHGIPGVHRLLERYKSMGITELHAWQFKGLNVARRAIQSTRNVLIRAPTGTGKTLFSEITLLQHICNTEQNPTQASKLALYVITHVADAEEKYRRFKSLFSQYFVENGFGHIGNLSGGERLQFKLGKYKLIVCTVERADSLIKRMIRDGSIEHLGIVIADEVHFVSDQSRGHTYERLLSKLLFWNKHGNSLHLPIVAASATMGDQQSFKQMQDWLRATTIETQNRPIPLQQHVVHNGQDIVVSGGFMLPAVHGAGNNIGSATTTPRLTNELPGHYNSNKLAATFQPKNRTGLPNNQMHCQQNTHYQHGTKQVWNQREGAKKIQLPQSSAGQAFHHNQNNVVFNNNHTSQAQRHNQNKASFNHHASHNQSKASFNHHASHNQNKVNLNNHASLHELKKTQYPATPSFNNKVRANYLKPNTAASTRKFFEICEKHVHKRENMLVFVHSVVSAESLARVLREKFGPSIKVRFHHAGLEPSQRQLVEQMFRKGQVNILVSTSTLQVGVNIAPDVVVVRWATINSSQYTQMIGRAGRQTSAQLTYSKAACTYLIAQNKQGEDLSQSELSAVYKHLFQRESKVVSQLPSSNLDSVVLEAIAMRNQCTITDVLCYIHEFTLFGFQKSDVQVLTLVQRAIHGLVAQGFVESSIAHDSHERLQVSNCHRERVTKAIVPQQKKQLLLVPKGKPVMPLVGEQQHSRNRNCLDEQQHGSNAAGVWREQQRNKVVENETIDDNQERNKVRVNGEQQAPSITTEQQQAPCITTEQQQAPSITTEQQQTIQTSRDCGSTLHISNVGEAAFQSGFTIPQAVLCKSRLANFVRNAKVENMNSLARSLLVPIYDLPGMSKIQARSQALKDLESQRTWHTLARSAKYKDKYGWKPQDWMTLLKNCPSHHRQIDVFIRCLDTPSGIKYKCLRQVLRGLLRLIPCLNQRHTIGNRKGSGLTNGKYQEIERQLRGANLTNKAEVMKLSPAQLASKLGCPSRPRELSYVSFCACLPSNDKRLNCEDNARRIQRLLETL